MTIADEFRRSLEVGLIELATNEWAVTEAREQVISDVTPSEAFENIVDVLSLAGEQTDPYAFASCCWLVLDLAKLSDTTELPRNLEEFVVSIAPSRKQSTSRGRATKGGELVPSEPLVATRLVQQRTSAKPKADCRN